MHYINKNCLSAVDTASQTGDTLDAQQWVTASFHAYFGDAAATGTLKVQASNDSYSGNYAAPQQSFAPTNWVDIPNATASIASGASALITISVCTYRWLRVVYTRASGGSSTINVEVFALYP